MRAEEEAERLANQLPWEAVVHVAQYGLTHLEVYGLEEKYGVEDAAHVGKALVTACADLAHDGGDRWVHELARYLRLVDGQLFGLDAEVFSKDDGVDWVIRQGDILVCAITVHWTGAQARLEHGIHIGASKNLGRTQALQLADRLARVAHAVAFAVRAWDTAGLSGQPLTATQFRSAVQAASSGAEL